MHHFNNEHIIYMDISSYLTELRINGNMVFDPVRKKWLVIQPEELVRQALLLYLLREKELPLARIGVEKAIRLHNQIRRFDLVYYDRHGSPLLLVECKSPSTPLTQQVLEQAVWYNYEIKAPYLLLSNGKDSKWYKTDSASKAYELLSGDGPSLT